MCEVYDLSDGYPQVPLKPRSVPVQNCPSASSERSPAITTVVVISDTHELHEQLCIPPGDVLVHCGDILYADGLTLASNSERKLKKFLVWFNAQPHPHKVFIAGNHDSVLNRLGPVAVQALASPAIYLCDSSTTIANLRFHGSPWSVKNSSFSPNGAFQDPRWVVPKAPCDVLVTHHPADGAIEDWISEHRPRLHLCGHWHHRRGVTIVGASQVPSFNCSSVTGLRSGMRPPVLIYIPSTTL